MLGTKIPFRLRGLLFGYDGFYFRYDDFCFLALDETAILGVATNVDHLARILRHPAFLSGAVDTGFLDTHGADLALPETGPATAAGAVIAAALAHPVLRALIRETPEPHGSIGFWRN